MENFNFKIEKNVPFVGPNRKSFYPFAQMVSGDSVWVPEEMAASARQAAYFHGSKRKVEIRTRTEGNGIRIWVGNPK